jgi:ABC-type transporter Mla maintaining outer membrane lipid asymmetry ATPase subunit MlaF
VASLHTPDLVVVDPVQWTVCRGECWVIGGLPASGKSDLLATAAGLMRPGRGIVRIFGQELTRLHEDQRLAVHLRVGMVFGAGGRLFNHLSVAENLSLPLCYHENCVPSDGDPRIRTVLEATGLTDIAHVTPLLVNRTLRQRVALARALVLRPELLFLDNPLAGLDPRESRWWIEFLRSLLLGHAVLEGRPVTLVAGTDDLEPWSELGRQFAFIHDGRFVTVGSRHELVMRDNPALRELLPLGWLRS